MSVTDVRKDPEARTMTITCEFEEGVERVWELWADPRQLERWWGPPGNPATVVEHDLVPGGSVVMSFGGQSDGPSQVSWSVREVDPPRALAFAFRDARIPELAIRVAIEARGGGGTRMTIETAFPSGEAMDHLLSIGFEAGLSSAAAQADAVLAGA